MRKWVCLNEKTASMAVKINTSRLPNFNDKGLLRRVDYITTSRVARAHDILRPSLLSRDRFSDPAPRGHA